MHAQTFALTKIQLPQVRSHLIDRPPLEAALAQALEAQRLVLLCAPAGFGKTTVLTRQLRHMRPGTAVAWVATDQDDDLPRLLGCLCAALEPYDLPWRIAPEALVTAASGSRGQWRHAVDALLNALLAADCQRGLLVFDDLHRVADPAVFAFLDLLLQNLGPQWGVVVSTRVEPPLALSRLRARDELTEFRESDLRFSKEETGALVAASGRGGEQSAALAGTLYERTGGWAAGVRLGLHTAAGTARSPRGDERLLFDYLASEVLADMPAALRDFLLRCSVLPQLTAARCAAVSRDAQAASLLAEIERRGLFVTALPADEPTLTLHDLFRDFLEDRLRHERPHELPLLLQRAAADEPDTLRRVGYLIRAAAWDDAEAVLCKYGPQLVARGAVAPLLRVIALFPAARRQDSARLAHLRGLCAWAHWDLLPMVEALAVAVAGHAAAGEHTLAQRAQALQVLGLMASGSVQRAADMLDDLQRQGPLDTHTEACAWQARGWHALAASQTDRVAALFAPMVDLLERSDDLLLWLQCVPAPAYLGMPGTQAPMQRFIDGALARAPTDAPSPLRVIAQSLQAAGWLWTGRVGEARALLGRVEADCRWLNRPPATEAFVHNVTALTLAVAGERDLALAAAQARIDGLDDERTSGRRATWLGHFLYLRLRIAATLDDVATLREMAEQLGAHRLPHEPRLFQRERAALPARLAEADGRWAEAAEGYCAALADEVAIDLYGQAHEVRVRLAHARARTGRLAEAAAALAPVLERARSGEIGGALLAGRRALAGLASVDWTGHLDPEGMAAVRAWARLLALQPPPAAQGPAVPVRPGGSPSAQAMQSLSVREGEVLARIAAGESNKLIARGLDLSPHTVKRHVANILDKLGLHSRGQAAAWHRSHH